MNLDFLGPFLNDQYICVMINQRTKYPDIEFMRSTSARNVIFALERFFSSYGIPNNTVSDNGRTNVRTNSKDILPLRVLNITKHTIIAPGKWSGRKIYAIIEQGLSNCLPREERLET